MYTNERIRDPQRALIESIEQDLGIEIHVLNGNRGPFEAEEGKLKLVFNRLGDETMTEYQNWNLANFPREGVGGILGCLNSVLGGMYYDVQQFANTNELPVIEVDADGRSCAIAYVGAGVVWIPWNFMYWMSYHLDDGWEAASEEFIRLVAVQASDPVALAEWVAGRVERERTAMIAYVRRSSAASVDTLINEIGDSQTKMDTRIREVAELRHKLRDRQSLLAAMMDARDTDEQAAADKAWALFNKDERIEDVRFVGESVVILTKGLDITHPTSGQTAYLGKMRIKLGLNGSGVTIQNTDNAKGGFDHPHVHFNNPCFGEMGDAVYTLIMQGELYTAVEMMFMFLSSINLNDDWGRRSAYWFSEENEEITRLMRADATEDYVDFADDEDYEEDAYDRHGERLAELATA